VKPQNPKHVRVPSALQRMLGTKVLKLSAANRDIVPLQRRLKLLLTRAWPDGDKSDISGLTVHLAALSEVSRIHMTLVRTLLHLHKKPDRAKLQDVAQQLYVNWCSDATVYLRNFEPELSKFKASLYRERNDKHHPKKLR
jgi:hypothetical protein